MFENEKKLYAFQHEYYRRLTNDLKDADLDVEVFAGSKTPRWLLGHLAVGNDYALKCLGVKGVCDKSWHVKFGPGSSPADSKEPNPSVAELKSKFEEGYQSVLSALDAVAPEALSQPHGVPMELLQTYIPHVGNLVAHLITTHFAVHLGQLSTWRRQRGMQAVL